MTYRHGTVEQPLPGDVRFHGGRLERFTLGDGWELLDTFRGEFREGEAYHAGDVVIRGGALWIATPEQGPDVWTCIAGNSQRGRKGLSE